MEMTDCAAVLRATQLLEELTDEQIGNIADLCQEETFETGQIIFKEGDTPDKVYVIVQGKVALDMGLAFSAHVRRRATIEIVTRGQPVGWSAVAGSEAFTMTARCLEAIPPSALGLPPALERLRPTTIGLTSFRSTRRGPSLPIPPSGTLLCRRMQRAVHRS